MDERGERIVIGDAPASAMLPLALLPCFGIRLRHPRPSPVF
jgi:hypothetical protein